MRGRPVASRRRTPPPYLRTPPPSDDAGFRSAWNIASGFTGANKSCHRTGRGRRRLLWRPDQSGASERWLPPHVPNGRGEGHPPKNDLDAAAGRGPVNTCGCLRWSRITCPTYAPSWVSTHRRARRFARGYAVDDRPWALPDPAKFRCQPFLKLLNWKNFGMRSMPDWGGRIKILTTGRTAVVTRSDQVADTKFEGKLFPASRTC